MKKELLLFTSICCFFLFFGITAHAEENLSATPDTWNSGTLSGENHADLYTIHLAKDGWVTLTLKGGTIQTANMRLMDVDGDSDSYYYEGTIERSSETDPKTTVSNGIALKKGTYIIRVSRFAAYSSGLEYTDGTYRMKYSFTAANNNETEPNDSFATAMPLTANQKVTGFLAQNDTLDYYSITIPSRQKIQIKCTAMLYTWIKICDEDLNLLKTVEGSYGTSESKPQVLTYEAELAAGTYYIKPSAGTNFNASYGNYILSWAPADTSTVNSLKNATVVLDPTNYAYTGKEICPKPVVSYKNTVLNAGTDYTLSYESNIEIGTGKVTVTGCGNYVGSVTLFFNICDLYDISICKIPVNDCIYSGKEQMPDPVITNIFDNNATLTKNTDYTLSYENNVQCGEAVITVTGIGKYKGSKKVTFDIVPRKTDSLEVESHPGWIRLRWTEVKEADGYELTYQVYKNSGKPEKKTLHLDAEDSSIQKNTTTGVCQYDIASDKKDLDRGVQCTFSVRAYKYLNEKESTTTVTGRYLYSEQVSQTGVVLNLPLATDCWGFSNPVNILDQVGKKHVERYITPACAATLIKEHPFGLGLCFGMSKIAGSVWHKNEPDIATLGENSLYNVKNWSNLSKEWKEEIKYAHASQMLYYLGNDSFSEARDGEQYHISTNRPDVIINQIRNYLYADGDPVLLKVVKANGDFCHVLLALDYIEEMDGTKKIQVYDPNKPGNNNSYITISSDSNFDDDLEWNSGENMSWTYDGGSGVGKYSGSNSGNNVPEGGKLISFNHEGTVQPMNLLAIQNGSASGKQIDLSELPGYRRIEVADAAENNSSGAADVFFLKKQDTYTFPFVPAEAEITIALDYHSVSITPSKDCSLMVKTNDKENITLEIKASTANDVKVAFTAFSADGNERNNIIVDGKGTSNTDMILSNKDSGLSLSGFSSLSLTTSNETEDHDDNVTENSYEGLTANQLDSKEEYHFIEITNNGETQKALVSDPEGNGSNQSVISILKNKKIDISSCTITLKESSFTATGQAITPAVNVLTREGVLLEKNKDYTVSYQNNIQPGTATIVVTGIGRNYGEQKKTFKIFPKEKPASLSRISITGFTAKYTGGSFASVRTTIKWARVPGAVKYYSCYGYVNSAGCGYKIVSADEPLTHTVNYGTQETTSNCYWIEAYDSTGKMIAKSDYRYFTDIRVGYYASNSFVYIGKAITPKIEVSIRGTVLKQGKDYTLSYSNNLGVGTGALTIYLKGNYGGKVVKYYSILPQGTKITSAQAKKKKAVVKWKKISGINGYQIQYATSKAFKKAKTVKITTYKTKKKTINKLSSGKNYYFRIRTYKKSNGKTYYSRWSRSQRVKVK